MNDAATRRWSGKDWAPEAAAAFGVLLLGVLETQAYVSSGDVPTYLAIVVLTSTAVLLCRRAPGFALALVWLIGAAHVVGGGSVMIVELAIMAVFFGAARWGHPLVVVLSGLSVPFSMLAALLLYRVGDVDYAILPRAALDLAYRYGTELELTFLMFALTLLAGPWLAGLALRFLQRAAASRAGQLEAEAEAAGARHEMEQAQEIARLREEQTRLAHDVHDVVGHSLAVILAQAESAQYAAETDTQKLKETMQTIATSARTSLQDVRHVLTSTREPARARPGGLDALIDGVRRSGHGVESTEVGRSQPLPPELEVVAYRVLQEMLTNAIRHGRRDHPVLVERHWPDATLGDDSLRIEVRNVADSPPAAETMPISVGGEPAAPTLPAEPAEPAGRGLAGMRRRLESVGGRLDARRRDEPDGPTFTVTAWVPVRPVVRDGDR